MLGLNAINSFNPGSTLTLIEIKEPEMLVIFKFSGWLGLVTFHTFVDELVFWISNSIIFGIVSELKYLKRSWSSLIDNLRSAFKVI